MTTILRARVAHTPRDPFQTTDALEVFDDGAIAYDETGTIEAVGAFDDVRALLPGATVEDRSDCIALPGFVDAHVHFPQIPVIGAMGLQLLDWLDQRTLPEEVRMGDLTYAQAAAERFVRLLAGNGTTTALVFGAHFPQAQNALFEAADASGLRIASGLVVSDRNLKPELEVSPDAAYATSKALRDRWHGHGRLRYAVTPRFSVSCTGELLEPARRCSATACCSRATSTSRSARSTSSAASSPGHATIWTRTSAPAC